MSNLRDYLEVPQLTKVADWLMEKQGVHNQIQEPLVYKYGKIDSEMMGKDFKQGMIDTVLMGNKKEMVMNKLELEIKELRERTGDNYMLNKMVNTDGVEFFAEYTLYKDYDKYFGLTLSGTSINIVDIMEEEFAEFLHQYRLSITYPQVQAVHEDEYLEVDVNDLSGLTVEEYSKYVKQGIAPIQGVGSEDAFMEDLRATVVKAKQLVEAYERYEAAQDWVITPEENETIKEQMESGETDKFTPMYDENDIDKQLVVDSKYDMSTDSFSESYLKGPEMWTETPTNTNPDYAKPWTETSTNTGENCAEPWRGCRSSESGTISVAPEAFYIDDGYVLISDIENKSDEEKLEESPNALKNTENKSGAELITKIISDIIKELFTEGTCSLNISLKQD